MTIADRVHDITLQIAAAASLADAQALLLWSQAMIGNIERGDLDIGIVSVELARMVPTALDKALALGLAQAGITLADWLVRSPLEEPDFEAAEAALLAAIGLGLPEACIELMSYRWFYRRDSCSPADAAQAFALLQAWWAAHPQDARALYLLALVTCSGFGAAAHPARAAHMLARAAALGNPDAMFELFIYYSNGIGVTVDEDQAIAYLYQAAEAGQLRAMYNLGAFHATGRYVEQDQANAVVWYTRAAEAGHAKAAETLAIMYEEGMGVEADAGLAEHFRAMLD
jgi:hypothetical protein